MKLTRRSFLRLGTIGLLAGLGGLGFHSSRRPELVEIEIGLKRLNRVWDGVRLGLITDIHAGPLVPSELIRAGVDLLRNASPDMLLLGGDLVSGATRFLWTTYGGFRPADLSACLAELARLTPPLGVYGVLGNHDFWSGPDVAATIAQGLSSIGVKILRNAAVRLDRGGSRLTLAGVDDYWEGSYNLRPALSPAGPEDCVILLSHNPDVNEDVAIQNRPVDLILSGHTHGGQVVLPLIGAPYLPSPFGQKYRAGLVRDGARQTYVSRGLGVFFVPVRLNCPPEVTLITLRSARGTERFPADS